MNVSSTKNQGKRKLCACATPHYFKNSTTQQIFKMLQTESNFLNKNESENEGNYSDEI